MLASFIPSRYLLFSFATALFLWRVVAIGDPFSDQGLTTALETVNEQFHQDLATFAAEVAAYRDLAERDAPRHKLQEQHLRTRAAFKRCEYLLEYLEPVTVRRHLNGAPLPKTEPKVPEIRVIEPVGLQVLDELVFAPEADPAEIQGQLGKLSVASEQVLTYYGNIQLQHRFIFEAAREEAVRIFTLGVTGFDTPGSGAAIGEALTALRTLDAAMAGYLPYIAERDTAVARELRDAFHHGTSLLERGEFETFDRLELLRKSINPLTRYLPAAQRLLDIESAQDNPRLSHPVNANAHSLFSADFLNPDYYARTEAGPLDDRRLALGELLFFDPVLSKDLRLSCASCHDPKLAFTDGKRKSFVRNAPTLINSVYADRYFYDLREEFLDRQIRHVVVDSLEFATDFTDIAERLNQSGTYRKLFAEAYGDQPRYQLSAWSISDALARYVQNLTALDSPFDRYARGETDELAPRVREGFNLFMGKAVCGTCHFAPTFSGLVPPFYTENETEVLGIPDSFTVSQARLDPDPGRIRSGRPEDEVYFQAFAFKTPTVRNVQATAPYMHNGVYQDLYQVVDFYNRGGGKGIGIHLEHQTLPFDSLGLDADEMDAIVHFMEALTDYERLDSRPDHLPTFEKRPEWNDRYRTPAPVIKAANETTGD
ncbi:cytochrome-c peroxidase [Lewinella sp. IMCC34191]|uniref:cytochrome-c peroxidase n=1 Tax=Lewinella sp. IMCC34191 TaxID=2259172 RepID=UPI000E257ECA|nr:cytochrome c peroxidase [Lewinella sp. IMCC34191]